MSGQIHLTIATPEASVVDEDGVSAVRAADASGSFGILPGHADLLTALDPSVVRWHDSNGNLRFCAVRGGILTVSGGTQVAIACRNALTGDRLDELEAEVRAARAASEDMEKRARVAQAQAHARAVRQLIRFLAPSEQGDLAQILAGPQS